MAVVSSASLPTPSTEDTMNRLSHMLSPLTHRTHAVIPMIVTCVLAVLCTLGFGVSAAFAEDADGTVTWAISPADEDGPDGRSRIELELDPGETVTEYLAVRNLSATEVDFALSAADGYLTPTGRFNMLPRDRESVDSGTWVSMQDTVAVAPNGVAILPVEISVPSNATPGDHAAGIAASIYSWSAGAGATVGVESRVGFRVMVRVGGTIAPGLVMSDLRGGYNVSWNPLEPGSVTLSYALQNTGNVRIAVDAPADDAGRAGAAGAAETTELLPGDTRRFTTTLDQQWPAGILSIPVVVEHATIVATGEGERLEPLRGSVAVVAIPWSQLGVLLGIGLLVAGVSWRRHRRAAHIERLVSTARDEGRRAASSELSGDVHSLPTIHTTKEES